MATFTNENSGDILEVTPPDADGRGMVKFNGRIVEIVVHDDIFGTVTLQNGKRMKPAEWSQFIADRLESGQWGKSAFRSTLATTPTYPNGCPILDDGPRPDDV